MRLGGARTPASHLEGRVIPHAAPRYAANHRDGTTKRREVRLRGIEPPKRQNARREKRKIFGVALHGSSSAVTAQTLVGDGSRVPHLRPPDSADAPDVSSTTLCAQSDPQSPLPLLACWRFGGEKSGSATERALSIAVRESADS